MNEQMTNQQIVQKLGKRLRQYRIRKMFTQQELAKRTAVSLPTIQRIESGRAHNVTLINLLSVLRQLGLIDNVLHLAPDITNPPLSDRCPRKLQKPD